MIGVAVYLVIGIILFVPLGFLVGFLQHKRSEAHEQEMNKPVESRMEDNVNQ
jgi:hypothetical protein